jgi:hypothetical protein
MVAQWIDPKEPEVAMVHGKDSLVAYVLDKNNAWRDYLQSNYYSQWDEYYRIWRGIWDPADKTRAVERSRIITPATQQAVESSVCEIEEATFGQGKYFDIRDDNVEKSKIRKQKELMATMATQDQGPMGPMGQMGQKPPAPPQDTGVEEDMAYLQRQLDEDFRRYKVRASTSEVLINAAVYGTGIAEVVVSQEKEVKPATQPVLDGAMMAFGTKSTPRVAVKMKPITIKNFRIDPTATSIENAHGVAIQEYVGRHEVLKLQKSGVYRKGTIGSAATDSNLDPDQTLDGAPADDKVEIIKYFGLVPKGCLEKAQNEPTDPEDPEYTEDLEEKGPEDQEDKYDEDELVEAIVIIANGETLLKAEANPFMMQDRPIVAFQWDIVPGVFMGRGVVEKGYNSQKALDAEIRARIDALALTIHPMMAMDATKIPRGHKPQIIPGKMILTNGAPSEVLMPFKFGEVSQITFAQAGELQKMVQQSTGAVDSTGVSGVVNGEATAAGISMSLGAIIKRQKRTLVNFQECFWIPFVEKAAWRYMQFSPEIYPIKDYNFVATSTLGIMAREYQVSQLVQLLQTMSPESPMYPKLVESIVDNMNITNRDELVAVLQKASAPNPEEQQMKQQMMQMELANKAAVTDYAKAQSEESRARAFKYTEEAKVVPMEAEVKKIDAITKNLQPGAAEDQEFAKRIKIAEVALKERGLNLQEKKIQYDKEASSKFDSLMGS